MAEVLKTFTNTDDEDFTGMFHGEPYVILAGESKVFTEKLARHLAGQLAYKLALKKGLDKTTPEEQAKIADSVVGTVEIPKVEEIIVKPKVVEEPKEVEFEDVKPKRGKKRK